MEWLGETHIQIAKLEALAAAIETIKAPDYNDDPRELLWASDIALLREVAATLLKMPSLRDEFAARAMQGMCADGAYLEREVRAAQQSTEDSIAYWAYRQADAMLKARVNALPPPPATEGQ